jgi:hypothetical protein
MAQKNSVEELVLKEFSGLVNQGFDPPKIQHQDWMTVIDYLGFDIGIEIELDWRDFRVFLLIVRLEAGALPKGYYVSESDGKPCRKHLGTLSKEQGWQVLEQVKKARKKVKKTLTVEDLQEEIHKYKSDLFTLLPKIRETGSRLFN